MKTAWFNKSILPNAMINSGFKPLHQSDHFDALDKCFKMTEGDSLLDLGCGIAEAGSTFTDYSYTGADLPIRILILFTSKQVKITMILLVSMI